jgi:hypothetical protein
VIPELQRGCMKEMENEQSKPRTVDETAPTRLALPGKAGARRGALAESAAIICAVLFAVSLGAASGLWINSRWASPASDGVTASSLLPPGTRAAGQKLPAPLNEPEQVNGDSNDPPAATAEARPSPDSDEPSSPDSDEPSSPAGARRMLTGETEDVGSNVGTDVADTAPSTARGKTPKEKAGEGRDGTRSIESNVRDGRGQGASGRCTLSASAGSVTISGGGMASITLRVGRANSPASVTAATPDWSDIAVFSEPGTGDSLNYSIRSVSNRAGVYRVSFRTPCGSKTVPVTVVRRERP